MNPQHEVNLYIDMAKRELDDAEKYDSGCGADAESYQNIKLRLETAVKLVEIALQNAEQNERQNKRFQKLFLKD